MTYAHTTQKDSCKNFGALTQGKRYNIKNTLNNN